MADPSSLDANAIGNAQINGRTKSMITVMPGPDDETISSMPYAPAAAVSYTHLLLPGTACGHVGKCYAETRQLNRQFLYLSFKVVSCVQLLVRSFTVADGILNGEAEMCIRDRVSIPSLSCRK